MMHRFKIILYCFFLTVLSTRTIEADENFEDAELVNEFITMSFSSSHPYDLRHTIPGEPDIDYPIYSAVPKTNFECNGRHEGYYADTETRCQVFRICTNTDLVGRGFAFLCPNGTLFSQKNFVCDWYRNVDCSESERYYSKNDNNRIGTKTEIMETVRQMMEHPMKTITIALNRGKPTTPQPITYRHQTGISTTKDPRIYRTSPAPIRNIPTQPTVPRRASFTLNQIESGAGLSQPYQQNSLNRGIGFQDSSPAEGIRSSQTSYTTLAPFTHRASTPTENSLSAAYNGVSPSQEAPLNTYPSIAGSQPYSTQSTANDKEVYVSNLGELSTDLGANFNPNTARIIAEPTSSSIDVRIGSESGSLNPNKMNFAAKVNAGLNGQRLANRNEIIAPEYVQNILHQNGDVPDREIQPPSYEFASNINSLLDEVAFEAELEGQNSMQVQLITPSVGLGGSTRKPFQFLSRGFSYGNTNQDGSYVYGPPTAQRSAFPRMQQSTSTQSYSNSFFTTPFVMSPAPVTSTEANHISVYESTSQQPVPNLNGRAANELILDDNFGNKIRSRSKIGLADPSQKDVNLSVRFGIDSVSESKTKLDSKSTIKREQREEGNQELVNNLNDIPQELNDGEKANANKRAEKLLLAGFKQTILGSLSDKNKTYDLEEDDPIIPLYIRVAELETTRKPSTTSTTPLTTISTTTSATPSTTTSTSPSSTTSTTPSTTPLTTTPTTTSTTASTTTSTTPRTTLSTTRTTPTSISLKITTTPIPSTTSTQSIRRYTINQVHRRPSLRPVVFTKRKHLIRSAVKSTSTTSTPTTTRSTARFGSVSRTTAALDTATTTRPTASIRKRPTVSRFSFGSRRRSAGSPNATTTTTAAPSKKLAVRSSDKDLSDLTAVASTYNEAPKRDYNAIRQNSYKSIQTQRRRPNHKSNGSQTTTSTTTTSTTTTTPQPRRSSSLPTPTLAPFTHETLSISPTTSTTLAPLPATYLSFNDLTKAIIDDSILQTFRRNQDNTGSTLRPPVGRSQPQAPIRQQFYVAGTSTPRPTVQPVTRVPYVPLKDFIASKFGSHYSPLPPKVSTFRPVHPTSSPNNELLDKMQKQPTYAPQYPMQQYVSRQDYVPRTVVAINAAPAVHQQIVQQPAQQNLAQRQPQFIVQQPQQVPQQQYVQLRQQQGSPARQYVQYQQQPVPTSQPVIFRPAQAIQSIQPAKQVAYRFPAQQQVVQRIPVQQQPQRTSIHQGQQILQGTIPAVQQLQQFQRTQPSVQPPQQQTQIQIFPSQITATQTIPSQQPNPVAPELGSINVRLPTNLSGLIPNTNLLDSRLSTDSLGRAQKRIDQSAGEESDTDSDAYSGVSSYDVPLSSVGRLANDITNLLRRLRRL